MTVPSDRVGGADLGETVAMQPEDLPAADPDATHAAATRVVARVPAVDAPERDGIDALSDPYFSPSAAPADLTTARPVVSIPSPVESLPERRRRRPRWLIALLVILAVALAAGAARITYDNELWGGKTIPTVEGLTEQEARVTLGERGFEVRVEYRATDDGFGTVLACDPAAGTRIDPAEGVTLTVAGERVVPSVTGLTEDDAVRALYDAGAAEVLVTHANSEEAPGTVIACVPAEGTPFVSTDQITITVAQPYTVPDLEGVAVDEALARLEEAGLAGSVSYVESDAEKNTVVGCDPAVGTEVAAGATVTLSVSSPFPSSPTQLLGYFSPAPSELAEYLADEGFSLVYGAVYAAGGNAHAVYEGASGDVLHISNDPETAHYADGSTGDVLAGGAGVGGVRYAFAPASLPEGASVESEAGVRAVMEACGLEGLLDTCTQDDVTMPAPVGDDAHFICGYGRQGDYTWAVRIGGRQGRTGVVALAAPSSHFSEIDLSAYGGSVCDYVAYIDLYTG